MSHSENVREFYRRQGEQRERERILKILTELNSAFGRTGYLAYVPDFIVALESSITSGKIKADRPR